MRRAALIVLFLVVAGVPFTAHAQAEGEDRIDGEVAWSGEVAVTRDLVVPNGSVLRIVGADVAFGNVTLLVERGGKLVVENDGDRRARLRASPGAAWTALVLGEAVLSGGPNAPVRIEGLGGVASQAGSGAAVTTLFNGGFTVRGSLVARHVAFADYTSGVLVGQDAAATFEDVIFASSRGLGLFVSGTRVDLEGAIFSGLGANLGFTSGVPAERRNATPSLLRSVLFSGVSRGITVRDADVAIEGAEFRSAPLCLGVTYSSRVTARGFTCSNFSIAAVLATASGGRRPEVTIDGFAIASSWGVVAAVQMDDARAVALANGTLGPVTGHGVIASKAAPAIVNTTYRGVGRYNVVLSGPPAIVRTLGDGGDSGAWGRLLVQAPGLAYVTDREGHPVPDATVTFHHKDNGTLARSVRTGPDGYALAGTLDALRVGPDGVLSEGLYLARVMTSDGKVVEREMRPNGRAVPFVVGSDAVETRALPVPGVALLLGVMAVLACVRPRP